MTENNRLRQQARAEEITRQLTGGKVTRGIVNAILALVVADERPEPPTESSAGPAAGARQILQPKKVQTPTLQDTLW